MGDELKFSGRNARADRDSIGEPLVGLIRGAYTPPGGEAYWAELEQRIITSLGKEYGGDTRWWNVLAPWARPALIAAAAIFALASAVNQSLLDADSQLTYDSVLEATTPEVFATAQELISVERGSDGATISYFLSH
jgi:hypothetical protein